MANGLLVRLMRGVYVTAEQQDSFTARAHAALRWAGPTGVLTGESALFVWGVLEEPPTQIQITLPLGTGRSTPKWIHVEYRSVPFETAAWVSMTIARTEPALINAFGRLPVRTRENLVFSAVHQGTISIDVLARALRQVPRVRARRQLERLVAAIAMGDESHLERAGSDTVFISSELKVLLRQHNLRIDGQRYRLDYFDPATRTAFELDGAAFHGNLEQRTKDIARDAILAGAGILTVRFGYGDVMDRPDWCRKVAHAVLQSRQVA